jgi:hypothetical protein
VPGGYSWAESVLIGIGMLGRAGEFLKNRIKRNLFFLVSAHRHRHAWTRRCVLQVYLALLALLVCPQFSLLLIPQETGTNTLRAFFFCAELYLLVLNSAYTEFKIFPKSIFISMMLCAVSMHASDVC